MSDQPTCETKLLPCPFCNYQPSMHEVDWCIGGQWMCRGCGAYGPRRVGSNEGPVMAWNTRNGQIQTDIGVRKES